MRQCCRLEVDVPFACAEMLNFQFIVDHGSRSFKTFNHRGVKPVERRGRCPSGLPRVCWRQCDNRKISWAKAIYFATKIRLS